MAIAMTLRGFNDLGRSVTPIFLLMGLFYVLRKNEKNLSSRILNILQNAPSNSVLSPLGLAVRQFQMPLYGLRFLKMMAIFEIINATDSLVQNIIRIVWLC